MRSALGTAAVAIIAAAVPVSVPLLCMALCMALCMPSRERAARAVAVAGVPVRLRMLACVLITRVSLN